MDIQVTGDISVGHAVDGVAVLDARVTEGAVVDIQVTGGAVLDIHVT